MKNLIVASTSTLFGGGYLEYLLPELEIFFKGRSVLFIPFARPGGISHEEYTQFVATTFANINIRVSGIEEFDNPRQAIKDAEAVFTGGGNTFLLVSQLYRFDLMDILADRINNGMPYLGTSAGSNITGLTMQTTNDMPIVYPPSFRTLGIIPFNLNPHYLDPIRDSEHMGETRETRIKEFHKYNSVPVLGLREGSWLEVKGDTIKLKGNLSARLFRQNQPSEELESNSDLSNIGR